MNLDTVFSNEATQWDDEVHALLKSLDIPNQKVAFDMVIQVLKLANESHDLHDMGLVYATIKELRRSYKVFEPFRDVRKVSIFGSARTPIDHPCYQLAVDYARLITQQGFMVITGAGPGIMEAGNLGAETDMSFGLNIRLPFEQESNPYIRNSTKLASFKYFFNRKLMFLKESDATILFPGGFGTHDEGFETLTLLQTGRCAPRPLILMDQPDGTYWKDWRELVKTQLADLKYINEEDLNLFIIPKTVEEAVEKTTLFYKTYHSVRYFSDITIIRLNHSLKKSTLAELNSKFKDILVSGQIEMCDPSEFSLDHTDYMDKYRLIFKFDRLSYGRLCDLIWTLNYIEN